MTSPDRTPPYSSTTSPIWSSRSPSPLSSPQTSVPSTSHSQTSGPASADAASFTIPQSIEGSEQPLIARIHYTNGYRAGISAGKDDPGIAQKGFDAGFPLGAALATRVGFLLEAVGEIVGLQKSEERGHMNENLQAPDQSARALETHALSFAEAQRDLDLTTLLPEMETLGLLETIDIDDSTRTDRTTEAIKAHDLGSSANFVDRLPSVIKWTHFVQQAGIAASPG